jgi:DHA1 family tetracycline resistance protein-like MFS transporter
MFGIGFILGPVAGGLLGGIDLRLPFFAAGCLALLNLLYGWFVLPESLPASRRRKFEWKAANPITALRGLAEMKGVGRLTAVLACSGLAQFVLYTCWVLYTTFKFGWGPSENGLSLAAVGVMSVVVQGGLLGVLLKRFSPQRLALAGLLSSSIGFALWGAATQGWMMYVVIIANVLGYTVTASLQSIISNAASADNQGRTLGAVSSLNSLMAVVAPVFGAPLLGMVSHLPRGDWRIGAPFYFCALLQAAAMLLAWTHFRGARRERLAAAAAPS